MNYEMTYEQFERDFIELRDRLAYQGIRIKKALLGPDARCALSRYPYPLIQMKPDDPYYGKGNEFMGIPWEASQVPGITFIHEQQQP